MRQMKRRAISARGLAEIARHVMECHFTQEKRIENACGRRGGRYLAGPALRQVVETVGRTVAPDRGAGRTGTLWVNTRLRAKYPLPPVVDPLSGLHAAGP